MSRVLAGKLAIVTGASRGIGKAIAEKIASYGANVALGYTAESSKSATEELAAQLSSQHNIRTFPVQADLGTVEGPKAFIASLKQQAAGSDGSFQIDILINNAGVAHNNLLPKITPEQFDISYRVNVLGPLLLTQAAEPYLPHDRSGRIVNISSISSTTGFIEQSVYGGTKAAIEAMTRTWARELSERCTVNAINPGPVEGPMYSKNSDAFKREIKPWLQHTPLMQAREGVDAPEVVEEAKTGGGRPAYTSEVAGIAAMLCGPDSQWLTGSVVGANGGFIFGLS
ncbi:short-chain dehydrogenase [Microdochium trichocladiopsis]|uniref:Short-chain dehydrogenase n=1 Tax=Microdochium trichocladiopsis TaxID=1682393 RepID=A0A9P8XZI9_9PEZI|nr:short-chain dehydrogenase [Microdochium trichocladiopsis]KAH7026012.1 short-chain dehydrogenase [Microdochium trichocladiopsis]